MNSFNTCIASYLPTEAVITFHRLMINLRPLQPLLKLLLPEDLRGPISHDLAQCLRAYEVTAAEGSGDDAAKRPQRAQICTLQICKYLGDFFLAIMLLDSSGTLHRN